MQQLGHWKTKTGKPGPKKRLLEDHTEALKNIVSETPDATLYEIRNKLSVHVSHQTVANELDLLGLVYKKTLNAAEQNRPDVFERREFFKMIQSFLNPEKLVFFDESFAKTNMTRLYGRAPRGVMLVEYVPHGHWITTTFACCLRLDGLCAPSVFEGSMNKIRFLEYVQKILIPCLNPCDILLLDNLQSHKNPEARECLRAAGISVLYLPPYSPDLNPIEMCFSKIKGLLRQKKKYVKSVYCTNFFSP